MFDTAGLDTCAIMNVLPYYCANSGKHVMVISNGQMMVCTCGCGKNIMNMGGFPIGNPGVMSDSQRERLRRQQEDKRQRQEVDKRQREQSECERRQARERERAIAAARAEDAQREQRALANQGRRYLAEDAQRNRRLARAGIDDQIERLQKERKKYGSPHVQFGMHR